MGRTKKVGSAGRFSVRYGKKIRERLLKAESGHKQTYKCQNCKKSSVRRVASGIWVCDKCGHKFAGKAYRPA
jgi:large subunit ribosomal protein L37Ae